MTIKDALIVLTFRCVWAIAWWAYTYIITIATTGSHVAATVAASITGSTLSKDVADHDRKATR